MDSDLSGGYRYPPFGTTMQTQIATNRVKLRRQYFLFSGFVNSRLNYTASENKQLSP